MSVTSGGEGGGGLIVGSVFAKVGALFDPKGWEQQQRAADEAKASAEKPIEHRVTANTQTASRALAQYTREYDGTKARVERPIETHIRAKVDPTGFQQANRSIDESRGHVKTFERDVDGFVGKLSGLGFGLSRFAGTAVEMVSALGAFEVLKQGTERMGELEKTSAVTEARLKSTGEVANVTSKHIDELAGALGRKAGVDHEQIVQGENLLLTFTHVRDEVGKNRDVYDQATRAALDLSLGTGRDLTASVRALGIALDNPEKGLTRLSRAGIIFTDQQKATIKSLLASGDIYKAQEMILGEVEKRYGGTADAVGKTMPAAIERAKVAFKDVSAELVTDVSPAISDAANWLSKFLDGLQHNTGAGATFRKVVNGIGTAIGDAATGVKSFFGLLEGGSRTAGDLRGVLAGVVAGLLAMQAIKTVNGLVEIGVSLWRALAVAMEANPFILVGAAIAAVTVALQASGLQWKDFGTFVSGVWAIIKRDVGEVVDTVDRWVTQHKGALDSIGNSVSDLAGGLANAASAVAKFVLQTGALGTLERVLEAIATAGVDVVAWVLKLVDSKGGLIAVGAAAATMAAVLTPLAGALAVEKVVAFGGAMKALAGNVANAARNLRDFALASVKGDLAGARGALSGGIFNRGGTGPAAAAAGEIEAITGVRGAGVGSEVNPLAVVVLGGTGGGGGRLSGGSSTGGIGRGAAAGEGEGAAAATGGRLAGIGGRLLSGVGIAGAGIGIAQIAGSAIGGSGGRTVSSFGSAIAGGAGIGSLFGPEGALAGAAGGAVGEGLVKLFTGGSDWSKKVADDAKTWGKRTADQITSSLPGAVSRQYRSGIQRALTDARQAQGAAAHPPAVPSTAPGRGGATPDTALAKAQAAAWVAAYQQEAEAKLRTAGTLVGKAFNQTFSEVKHPTTYALLTDFEQQIKKVPQGARASAALTVTEMAAGLQAKGDLPKGSLQTIIKKMEGLVPGFRSYMNQMGFNTAQDFADNMRMQDAQHQLNATIGRLATQFGFIPQKLQADALDPMGTKLTAAMKFMEGVIHNSTGKQRDDAVAAYKDLQGQADKHFTAMEGQTAAHMKSIRFLIQDGSVGAANDAGTAFTNLKNSIQNAIASSTITASKGFQLIAQATNTLLTSYGLKPIPVPELVHQSQLIGDVAAGKTGASALVHRQGGRVDPDRGTWRDLARLRAGGFLGYKGARAPDQRLVLAADGEAFLTGHDQPHVDRALATAHLVDPGGNPYGSLDHMFGSGSRPGHFAQGGRVGLRERFAQGGQVGGGSHLARLLSTATRVSNANFPYHWGGGHEQPAHYEPFDCSGAVSYAVQQAGYKVPTVTSGNMPSWNFPSGEGDATIFYNPTHTFMKIGNYGPKGIGYWGTSGFARPGGGAGWFDASPGAGYLAGFSKIHLPNLGGAGDGQIGAPQVRGTGLLSDLVRRGMRNTASGANRYINSLLASMGGGGGQALEHVKVTAGGGGQTVGASDYGGPADPLTGHIGYRGDDLDTHPDSFAELNLGKALGNLPYMARLKIAYKGRAALAYKRDIGLGGGAAGGFPRSIDLWWRLAQSLGFPYPGLGAVQIQRARAGGRVVAAVAKAKSTAPHISGSHAKGTGSISQHVLDTLTKSNPKLARDLVGLNKYDTDLSDLDAKFGRTQREQEIADRPYGDQVPARVVKQQTDALLKIKRQEIADLTQEGKHASRIKKYLDAWLPNRKKAELQDEHDITVESNLVGTLTSRLTALTRRQQDARTRQSAANKLRSLQQRLGKLRSQHGHTPKGPAPPRFDPYGNKLPPVPGGTATHVDNSKEIAATEQEIAATRSAVNDTAGVKEKRQLQDQIAAARKKLSTARKDDSAVKKEITALEAVAQTLGDAADPQTGIAGQIKDAKLDITDLTTTTPTPPDFTDLPTTEQKLLDETNYKLSVAEGLPADQQPAAEIPIYQGLVNFWTSRLGELRRLGAPFTALTDVQNNINAAQQQVDQLSAPAAVDQTADQSAQLTQAQTRATNLQALLTSSQANINALTSSGDIGTGGYFNALGAARASGGFSSVGPGGPGTAQDSPAGSIPGLPGIRVAPSAPGSAGGGAPQVVLNVNALHPGDPGVLKAIGETTVNALNGQNFTRSNRETVLG